MAIKEKQIQLHMVIHTDKFGDSQFYSFKTYELAEKHANELAKSLHPAAEDYMEISDLLRGAQKIDIINNTLFEYFEVADDEAANG